YIETYLASEGFLAFQSRPGTSSMQLVVDNGIFFEFVPFNDRNFDTEGNLVDNPEALTIAEVEENREYAILLSTNAGAWRYLIGDTIKFTSLSQNEIVITGRTKHFLSICGEHLSQDNMNRAIQMMEEQLNVEVREFTVAGTEYGSMFAHRWYIGTDHPLAQADAREHIDDNLKVLNDDYRVERIAAIREVFVTILPSQVFYDFMKSRGKEGGQTKFPRVLKGENHRLWESFLKEKKLID
ncbi:MAG: GH3 auxin-responsive promoter family protein, partial [Bacteroidales bacterium]|nr:GH3 auxin-responsive promoter family protein [Bacteroidales bacterium]